ncbi:MAG: PAS domain-containing protein [Syntrophobacterales bacterium]
MDIEESDARGKDLGSVIDLADSGIRRTITDYVAVLEREVQHRKKTGEVIPLALSATPIRDEAGAYQGAVIVLRDLSEIKKLQEKKAISSLFKKGGPGHEGPLEKLPGVLPAFLEIKNALKLKHFL